MAAPGRPKTSKNEVDENNVREIIREAALECFARYGFDGASMPKIGEAAGVGHSLVHYHFKSKDLLWRAVVENSFGGLIDDMERLEVFAKDLTPLDRLRLMVRALVSFAAKYPSHFSLVMAESRARSDRFVWIRKKYIDDFFGRFSAVIRDAQQARVVKNIPASDATRIILGAVVLSISLGRQDAENKEAEIETLADWVIEIIFNGIVQT